MVLPAPPPPRSLIKRTRALVALFSGKIAVLVSLKVFSLKRSTAEAFLYR